jgi:hypothetical protein
MSLREEWEEPRSGRERLLGDFGMGALRVTLLFGSAAVGLALILTPLAESQVERMAYSSYSSRLDTMATGTVGPRASGSYTVRRSVLQPSPSSVCIIRSNGARTGDC